MEDPRTLWLTITNVALAVVVVTGFVTVTFTFLYEAVSRARRRARLFAEIDRDLSQLLSVYPETLPKVSRRT